MQKMPQKTCWKTFQVTIPRKKQEAHHREAPRRSAHCTPPNYSLLSFPRTSSKNTYSQAVGGGTGFLIREPFTQLPTSHTEFSSFESSSVTLKLPHSKISVFNIYRPPSSSTFSKPFSVFLDEFNSFLSFAATTPHEFINHRRL